MSRWAMVLITVAGCGGPSGPPLLDTGWFDDTGFTLSDCPARVVSVSPEDGSSEVFYREGFQVSVGAKYDGYVFELQDALGVPVPLASSWSEGGLIVDLTPETPLAPEADYTLWISDCAGRQPVEFRTSVLGSALEGGPESIRKRSYRLKIEEGLFVKPGGFGSLLQGLFGDEVLLGVSYVTEERIDWMGGLGILASDGLIYQQPAYNTWSFPLQEWQLPWFEIESEEVALDLSGSALPVYDFSLSGVFTPDGEELRQVTLIGLADTRYSGAALGAPNNPAAVCNAAEGLGVPCVACPDDGPYCLEVEVQDLSAEWIPYLTLRQISAEP